jgi:hypothetical protein
MGISWYSSKYDIVLRILLVQELHMPCFGQDWQAVQQNTFFVCFKLFTHMKSLIIIFTAQIIPKRKQSLPHLVPLIMQPNAEVFLFFITYTFS